MKSSLSFCGNLILFFGVLSLSPGSVLSQVPLSHPNLIRYENTQATGSSDAASDHLIFQQVWDDLLFLTSEPDFYGVVGVIGLAPSVFGPAFQRESPEFTELWQTSTNADNFFEVGEMAGNGALPVLASATTWGVGKVTGSARLSRFGSDLFRAQAMTGLFTTILKGSINRTRPDGAPYSYPSGHTSAAFAAAGTVYAHFGKTWGIPAFVFAGYVGLSRLQEGKHYLSDVIAGGILGSFISLKLARHGNWKGPISVFPLKTDNGVGLSLSFKF